MSPQMEALIMLQDLDLLIKEMGDERTATQMTRIGFALSPVEDLREARDELARKVEPDLLAAYARLMQRYQRAVVPVRNNTCLACFLKQPTKYTTADDRVRACNNCKRFLYYI